MARSNRKWLVGVLLLAGCSDPDIESAKTVIRASLRDPESAKFEQVERCGTSSIITGQVNAKNAYGGYTGREAFVVSGDDGAVESGDLDTFIRLVHTCTEAINRNTMEIRKSLRKS